MKKVITLLLALYLGCLMLAGCNGSQTAKSDEEVKVPATGLEDVREDIRPDEEDIIVTNGDHFLITSQEFKDLFNKRGEIRKYKGRINEYATSTGKMDNGESRVAHSAELEDGLSVGLVCLPDTDYVQSIMFDMDYSIATNGMKDYEPYLYDIMLLLRETPQDQSAVFLNYSKLGTSDQEAKGLISRSEKFVYFYNIKNGVGNFSIMATPDTEPNKQGDDRSSTSPTMGQKNSLSKAYSYLEASAFSYTGLVDQLKFEGFTDEEAKYAVDNCGADWNEQAAKKAKQYLKSSSFSRQSLIDQLKFEGFTAEQAEYGVSENGY